MNWLWDYQSLFKCATYLTVKKNIYMQVSEKCFFLNQSLFEWWHWWGWTLKICMTALKELKSRLRREVEDTCELLFAYAKVVPRFLKLVGFLFNLIFTTDNEWNDLHYPSWVVIFNFLGFPLIRSKQSCTDGTGRLPRNRHLP